MGYLDEHGNPTGYDGDKLARGQLYQTQDTLPRSDGMSNAPVWGEQDPLGTQGTRISTGSSSGCGFSLKTMVWLVANYLIYLFGFEVYGFNKWLGAYKYYIIAGYILLIFLTLLGRTSDKGPISIISIVSIFILYPAAFVISYTLVFLLFPGVTPNNISFEGIILVNLITYTGQRLLTLLPKLLMS